MEITELLMELNYRVLAEARDGMEARQRLAVVAHWASEKQARLAAGNRAPRLETCSDRRRSPWGAGRLRRSGAALRPKPPESARVTNDDAPRARRAWNTG